MQCNLSLLTVLNTGQICLVKLAPSIICSGQLVTVLGLYFEKLGLHQVFFCACLFEAFLKEGFKGCKPKNIFLSK